MSIGSSPRVRGTGFCRFLGHFSLRFIPACAGNRTVAVTAACIPPVHPRVCGEQLVEGGEQFKADGSSPRVRGTDSAGTVVNSQTRFIPACAGNSGNIIEMRAGTSVHPRVCGKQRWPRPTPCRSPGSSPRVRGTEIVLCSPLVQRRFIPACAGNSLPHADVLLRRPVHPRVCGEQTRPLLDVFQPLGSSPRVRGTGQVDRLSFLRRRFIPACAGNSDCSISFPEGVPVHPRVCGEQRTTQHIVGPVVGSSPRVRGTARVIRGTVDDCRFIPACAGNSRKQASLSTPYSVHPRVCGEQASIVSVELLNRGSSPRVRGTVRQRCHCH